VKVSFCHIVSINGDMSN